MIVALVSFKAVAFDRALVDSRYVTKALIIFIESLGNNFYCPLKNNRQIDDSGGEQKYSRTDSQSWTPEELAQGKLVKIKGFPKDHKAKLLRVAVSTIRTDFIAINDLVQNSIQDTKPDASGGFHCPAVHTRSGAIQSLLDHSSQGFHDQTWRAT